MSPSHDPVPWAEVNAADARTVAAILDLTPSRERGKFACIAPGCSSSDAMHAYAPPGSGFYCWSCTTSISNVDAAAIVWGLPAVDACRRLADQLGVFVLDTSQRVVSPARRREIAVDLGLLRRQSEVYTAGFDALTLTDLGRGYAASRGLEPVAERLRFRSVDGLDQWREMESKLRARFPEDRLRESLFPLKDDGTPWLPWGGRVPCLLLPYLWRGAVVGLRARALVDTVDCRYLCWRGQQPVTLYNADALDGCAGQSIALCEGELNCAAVLAAMPGARIAALGAASTPWRASWSAKLAGVRRLVLFTDDDKAGQACQSRIAGELVDALGETWVRERVVPLLLIEDFNDMHRAGQLASDPVAREHLAGVPAKAAA